MKTIANKPFPVWFFLFLLLLRPVGLVHILSIESITRLLCEIISILFFIYGVYSRKLTIPNILYIVYTLYLLLCTLFNGTNADITEMLKVAVCNIGIVCFINYIIFKDTYNALKSMYAVYLVLIVLNLLYTLKNPSGYNLHDWNTYRRGYYLFGHQNSTITYVLPAICIALIAFHKNIIKKRQAILIIVFSVASIVMAFSATSLVGLIIFFLVFGLMKMGNYIYKEMVQD